jgi:hypothetical protein
MDAPKGTFIAFATAPGRIASDGSGRNGLYTRHLLVNLTTPGLKLEDLFKRVRAGVLQDSAEQQMPWDSSSLMGDFFFRPGAATPSGAATLSAPLAEDASALDLAFWNSIKDSSNRADFEAYLARFPQGTFAGLARNRLASQNAPPGATVPEPVRNTTEIELPHTFLGVFIQELTPDVQVSLGASHGVLVADVTKGSPADQAGFLPLDVITAMDGQRVDTPSGLVDAVRAHKPGDRIRLQVLRERRDLILRAELVTGIPTPPEVPNPSPSAASSLAPAKEDMFTTFFGGKSVYGFFATELTPELRQQLDLGTGMRGVIVSSVDPQGPAKDMLSAGDVVLAVLLPEGKRTLATLPDYLQAIGKLSQKSMNLLVYRTRYRQNTVVTIPFTPQPK